jgi:hypothetical protein
VWNDAGVCDDSCGIIEMVTTGSSTEYPNLMDKSTPLPVFFIFVLSFVLSFSFAFPR